MNNLQFTASIASKILIMSVISDILSHFEECYDFEPVRPSHLINDFGYSMPLQGRDELIGAAKQLYDARWENRSTRDHVPHKIGLIGGCSGIGKSRALIQIAESVKCWIKRDQWSFEIVITYNNGHFPGTDRSLSRNVSQSASTGLALRILYFSFVAGKSFKKSFESFVLRLPKKILEVLTPEIAIETVGYHLSELYGHNNGVIFIGLDEANYLVDSDYNGEKDERAFLTATLMALKGAMLLPDRFVFVVIASIDILPINAALHQSGLHAQPLPISLLHWKECETIVSEMISTSLLSEGWAEWRNCRAFRTLLADFAPIPRKAENILNLINDEMKKGLAVADIDYQVISYKLMNTSTASSTMLLRIADRIVSNIFLATHVRREQIVDVIKSPLTYGKLEAYGAIVLATSTDAHLTVQMPYFLFRILVEIMDRTDPLTQSLMKICNRTQSENEYGLLSWQTFKILHCNVEAVREMLIARRDLLLAKNDLESSYSSDYFEGPHSSLREFYCLTIKDEIKIDFDFILRQSCSVMEAGIRYIGSTHCIIDVQEGMIFEDANDENFIISHMENPAFDSFTMRQLSDWRGGKLFCIQQKRCCDTALSAEMISEEVIKVGNSLPEGKSFVLVMIALKVTSDALENIPDNCIVVTGPAVETFYSVFSARVNLLSVKSLSQINVNTAKISDLMTIDVIGRSTAASIIMNRKKNGCFTSWGDFVKRIPRARKCEEDNFTY